MVRVRLTRRQRANAGFVAGCALMVLAAWLAFGVAAAVFAAGLITAASFLLLYDVESGEVEREPPAVHSPFRGFDPTL